jgi:TRAP-type C4-dicarboxylate transport system substrate-binding protein
MSSKETYDKMSKAEKKELDKLMKEITEAAKKVVEDYAENPSEEIETDVQIDFDSPYLDEVFEGESWKKVVKPQYVENLKKSLKKDKKKKKNDKKT